MSMLRNLYRKIRYGEPIVVISGLPRSGTSMLMKMLEAGGLPILTDRLRAADESNPQGYYELERVKELDKNGDTSWLREARGKLVFFINQSGELMTADNVDPRYVGVERVPTFDAAFRRSARSGLASPIAHSEVGNDGQVWRKWN